MEDNKTKDTAEPAGASPFSTGLWAEALSVTKRNPKAFAIYFAASLVMAWAYEDVSFNLMSMVSEALASVILLIPLCFSILKDRAEISITSDAAGPYLISFTICTLALNALSYAPGAVLATFMLANGFSSEASDIALVLVYLPTLCAVFAKWGTMLPAIIDDGDASLQAASKRSQKTFSYAFWKLLLAFLTMVALLFIAIIPDIMCGDGSTELYSTTTGLSHSALYKNVVTGFMSVAINAVFAIILSRSYLLAEGRARR